MASLVPTSVTQNYVCETHPYFKNSSFLSRIALLWVNIPPIISSPNGDYLCWFWFELMLASFLST